MRLLLVRHGQTHANVARQLDTAPPGADLTDLGREQAAALVERLAPEGPRGLYVSDLRRTHQTAAPLARALGVEPVALPGLREIQAGVHEMSTDWEPFVAALGRWGEDLDHAIPGGESGREFLARYDAAIGTIAAAGHETAVAISHGAAMRVWVSVRCVLGPEALAERRMGNTEVLTLEGEPGEGWRLLAWGDERLVRG